MLNKKICSKFLVQKIKIIFRRKYRLEILSLSAHNFWKETKPIFIRFTGYIKFREFCFYYCPIVGSISASSGFEMLYKRFAILKYYLYAVYILLCFRINCKNERHVFSEHISSIYLFDGFIGIVQVRSFHSWKVLESRNTEFGLTSNTISKAEVSSLLRVRRMEK